MNIWSTDALVASRHTERSFAHTRRTALVAAGLGLLSLLGSSAGAAPGSEPAAAAAEQADAVDCEDSLLVATRGSEVTPSPDASAAAEDAETADIDGEPLEPISQSSEYAPDLAGEDASSDRQNLGDGASDPDDCAAMDDAAQTARPINAAAKEDDNSSQFASALAKVAQPTKVAAASMQPVAHRTSGNSPSGVAHKPVKFQGLTVGASVKQDLIAAWGKPANSIESDEGTVLSYEIEPFAAVEVLIGPKDVVSTIKVSLAEAIDAAKLAEQLELNEIEPVLVFDEEGQPLGEAFPERGVLFMFEEHNAESLQFDGDKPSLVSHVAIQPLDARAFALRAENHLSGPFEKSLGDLTTAITLEPDFARAHWLLAGIYLTTGQADAAVAEAATACDLEPNNVAFQLRRGQTLALLGEYDEAVHTVRAVLDRHDTEPIVRAQALHEMARLASLGDVQIASKAIPFDTRAIEIADRVVTTKDEQVRRAAKQLLVEAHMAVGEEIARQAYNQKVESLSLWIGRASGLAEEYIANDGGSIELRLFIAQRALAALASFKPTLDPAPWVGEAEEAATDLFAQSNDDVWQQHIKWELGIAYLYALRVEHSRRESANALRYGQLAVQNLAEGALSRQAVHSSEQLVAQLYFHMGAVYAVHQQDHLKAMPWFDKAVPLLTGPRPVSELYSPRREGEMLVSVGVSCWQVGQQARALELTRSGVGMVEMAVEDGILSKSALAVPYGNLATMYEQMGESTNAAKYLELAKSVSPPSGKQSNVTAGTKVARQNGRAMQTTGQQVGGAPSRR